MTPPTRSEWMSLPVEEIAALVTPYQRALLIGQDGTRRYAYLRDPASRKDWVRYTQVVADATLALVERCFAFGLQTVMVGMLWPPNFERGESYTRAFLSPAGLPRLADEQHRALYERWNVRARLSGCWRQADERVVEELETIAQQLEAATPTGERLLLWEADAGNIMDAALRAALRVGPSEEAVRAALYPDGPEQIHLAIKPGRIRSLNRIVSPLLLNKTDLYITNNLTLDLTEAQLRAILYDHLFMRDEAPDDNMSYSESYLAAYETWYKSHPPRVTGLGELDPGGNWVVRGGEAPEPQAPSASLDEIQIQDLLVRTVLGISPEERKDRQDVLINLTIYGDTHAASLSDQIEEATNYRSITKRVIQLAESSSYQLLETLVNSIARSILTEFKVERVRVRAEKPGALRFARSVAVEITRTREALVP